MESAPVRAGTVPAVSPPVPAAQCWGTARPLLPTEAGRTLDFRARSTAGEQQQQQLWSVSQALPVLPGLEQHLPVGESSPGLNVPPAALQLILDCSCCSLLGSLE